MIDDEQEGNAILAQLRGEFPQHSFQLRHNAVQVRINATWMGIASADFVTGIWEINPNINLGAIIPEPPEEVEPLENLTQAALALERQRTEDELSWDLETTRNLIESNQERMVIGIRVKIFDASPWRQLSPIIQYLERFPVTAWMFRILYRFLDHPGPRHAEYFHIRRARSMGISGGHISSFETLIKNETLCNKLHGCPSKIAIGRFNHLLPNENWILGAGHSLLPNDGIHDRDAELSRNCRYTYRWVRVSAENFEAYNEILLSYRPNGGNEPVVPSLVFTDQQYFLRRYQCGTYAMNLVHHVFNQFWNACTYSNYDQFVLEVNNYLNN